MSLRLKVGLDTSCLVPLFAEEHFSHEPTRIEYERLERGNAQFIVACHALLECFSVLTRMPPPYRRTPEETERILRESFGRDVALPGVDSPLTWSSVREVVAAGLFGGKVYDAVIARATFAAGASVLLTWNPRDFLRVSPAGLEILTPTEFGARPSRLH